MHFRRDVQLIIKHPASSIALLMTALVLVSESLEQRLFVSRGTQAVAEMLLFQQAGNPGEGFEMGTRGIFRGDEEEKDVDRLPVQRIEVQPRS